MNASVRTVRLLGYAGLIPFVVPALLVSADSEYAQLSRLVAQAYAFGIISFLTGSWWGMGLKGGLQVPLILSNLYFLVALFIFLFAPAWWALAAAILLMSIFFTEQHSSLFAEFPGHYRTMRTILTLVAGGSMMVLHLAN